MEMLISIKMIDIALKHRIYAELSNHLYYTISVPDRKPYHSHSPDT